MRDSDSIRDVLFQKNKVAFAQFLLTTFNERITYRVTEDYSALPTG